MNTTKTQRVWTDERVDALKDLWRQGYSCSIIADRLGAGLTRNAIIGKVHRMGLSGRVTSDRRMPKPRKRRNRFGDDQRQFNGRRPIPRKPSILDLLPSTPLPPPSETDIARVAFADLEPHHCRWVIGEPTDGQFCGCKSVPGLPYCEHHARRAYRAPEPRNAIIKSWSPSVAKLPTGAGHTKPVEMAT